MSDDDRPLTWVDLWGIDPDYPAIEAEQTAARIAELEAQLAAARAALAACREVAGKRAGKGTQPCVEVPLSDGQGRTGPGDHR